MGFSKTKFIYTYLNISKKLKRVKNFTNVTYELSIIEIISKYRGLSNINISQPYMTLRMYMCICIHLWLDSKKTVIGVIFATYQFLNKPLK